MLAEGFVRIFYPFSRAEFNPDAIFEIDNYLGWKFKAGISTIHHSRYFNTVYTTNSLGYRDKSRDLVKNKSIHRILLYGDSQVFGWGIPENQRFSNLIENQNHSIEIWNLALPGYGLDQQILSYEKDGESLNADQVIFFVSKATLKRTRYGYIYKKFKPKFVMDQNGTLILIPVPRFSNALRNLLYKTLSPFYLPYFIEGRLEIFKNAFIKNHKTDKDRFSIDEIAKRMLEKAMKVALDRRHLMTVLISLPQTAKEDLKNFCYKKGISFFEITFRDENQDLEIGKYEHHWNHKAHKLIAEQLLKELANRKRKERR